MLPPVGGRKWGSTPLGSGCTPAITLSHVCCVLLLILVGLLQITALLLQIAASLQHITTASLQITAAECFITTDYGWMNIDYCTNYYGLPFDYGQLLPNERVHYYQLLLFKRSLLPITTSNGCITTILLRYYYIR